MSYTVVFQIWTKDEAPEEEFMAHWTGEHADLVKHVPHLRGYEIMRATSSIDAGENPPGGFVVLRFDSREDADAALASPEMAAAGADSQTYFSDFAAFHVDAHKII
jgi:uncharacterized protein (TIGR02118 family)